MSRIACTWTTVLACALPAVARQSIGCSTGGSGGPIPANGSGDGNYPTVLPTYPLISSLFVGSLPAGASVVTELKVHGMFHTFVGDLQFVLQDPAGNLCNVYDRPSFGCHFNGDYTFIGPCIGGSPVPGSCSSVYPPATYEQFFGDWPSGTNGISNTALYAIPAATGTWTLYIYDWSVVDIGSLTSWDICFGTVPTLPPPGSPTQTAPPNGNTISSPAKLLWGAGNCATSYDIDIDGVITSGVISTNCSAAVATGGHAWRVRAVNPAGASSWVGPSAFTVPAPPPPSVCVPGGAGGPVPTSGTGDGTWPGTLPSAPATFPLMVTVPAGATKIVRVRLNQLFHTYIGDTHFVLEEPSGALHNVLHRPGFTGQCCGAHCDWAGDYSFYETGGITIDTTCADDPIIPGDYLTDFGSGGGTWPSGTNGILNTRLGMIPISSGVWVLRIYDWAGSYTGTLASWELCFDAPSGPVVYCTAGTSTNGCVPSISATGQPSATLAHPCSISIANVEGQKFGIIFYGITNSFTPTSWALGSTSFLCVKGPAQRAGSQNSNGTPNSCNGTLSLDWNAYQASHTTSLGNPFSAGNQVYVQGWYRDPPAPKATNLSDGLLFLVGP